MGKQFLIHAKLLEALTWANMNLSVTKYYSRKGTISIVYMYARYPVKPV